MRERNHKIIYRLVGGPLDGRLVEVGEGFVYGARDGSHYYWPIEGKDDEGHPRMKFVDMRFVDDA